MGFTKAWQRGAAVGGEFLREIAFPLGGLGTGSVSLDGRGGLRDWEIYGRPNKNTELEYTFPALWVRTASGESRAVTLQGPQMKEWVGAGTNFWSYGHGQFFRRLDGLPCMDSVEFAGTFPCARLQFRREGLPVVVSMEAYAPFIPLDTENSSIPGFELAYTIANTSDEPIEALIAWTMKNPVGEGWPDLADKDQAHCTVAEDRGRTALVFGNGRFAQGEPGAGSFVIATDWPDVEALPAWSSEGWWDSLRRFWNAFREGRLPDRVDAKDGYRVPGTLACRVRLMPGESAVVPFVFSWSFPVVKKYWGEEALRSYQWTQHYALKYPTALSAAMDLIGRREELKGRTEAFEEALHDSTLPVEIVRSVADPLSTLRTTTLLRLEDGTFWAWEGCSSTEGCCEGTCSHVWNYAIAHAYLFPEIQRSFLDTAFASGFHCGPPGGDGAMRFRIPIPLMHETELWHAASDGQLGQIVQVFRDWRLTGDTEWLKGLWPSVKRAMAYAWVQWDRDRDGLVDGDMHNTYDINFVTPNPLAQGFYLASLAACERMALALGEDGSVYAGLLAKGVAAMQERLFNGEFYIQEGDFTQPEDPRYQHGAGCLSDQVFGLLCAEGAGLGTLVDSEQLGMALASIFRYNFRDPLGDHENLQRVYAVRDESGLLLCSWPNGGQPFYPFVYSDEVWGGIEYQVANHLVLHGMRDEALRVVSAVRRRHDGRRRNPWNEFECGSHYARQLASYGLLNAWIGLRRDAVEGTLTFGDSPFRSFFCVPGAWGVAERRGDGSLRIEVREGSLPEPR